MNELEKRLCALDGAVAELESNMDFILGYLSERDEEDDRFRYIKLKMDINKIARAGMIGQYSVCEIMMKTLQFDLKTIRTVKVYDYEFDTICLAIDDAILWSDGDIYGKFKSADLLRDLKRDIGNYLIIKQDEYI